MAGYELFVITEFDCNWIAFPGPVDFLMKNIN